MLLPSLIFVQNLPKLSNSFKDSRIPIHCQEMGNYKSAVCSHSMFLTGNDADPENYGLSENQTLNLC